MNLNSLSPNTRFKIFDTIQVTALDFQLINGAFYIGNPLEYFCRYEDIRKATITVGNLETLQETTLTAVAAANSVYAFNVSQFNPITGLTMVKTYTHTTAAAGATATTISAAFIAAVNADTANGTLQIDATGAATIILTAKAGYPTFTVGIYELGGGLTQNTGTPGVRPTGTLAELARIGVVVTGAEYATIVMDYAPISGANIKDEVHLNSQLTVYLNEAATNYAALLAAFQYLLAGRSVSVGGVANPEALAYV